MENYAWLTKEEKSLYWKNHFALWKESGLSQKKYCQNNSVSYWNFNAKMIQNKAHNARKYLAERFGVSMMLKKYD